MLLLWAEGMAPSENEEQRNISVDYKKWLVLYASRGELIPALLQLKR